MFSFDKFHSRSAFIINVGPSGSDQALTIPLIIFSKSQIKARFVFFLIIPPSNNNKGTPYSPLTTDPLPLSSVASSVVTHNQECTKH